MAGGLTLTLTLAVLTACGRPSSGGPQDGRPEPTTLHREVAAMSASQTGTTPSADSTRGLPDELKAARPLWETQLTQTPSRPGSTSRLYANGQLFTWSNSRRTSRDGKISREAAPYAWRLDAQVSPDGVARVRELIRTEFVGVPSGERVRVGADQGTVTYRAHADAVDHQITVPATATAQLPAAVRAIEDAIRRNITPGGVPNEQPPDVRQ